MTPWTGACWAPLSVEFFRQEYWSGLPFPSPRDLPNPGIEPGSPALQADSLLSEPPGNFYNTFHTNNALKKQPKNKDNIFNLTLQHLKKFSGTVQLAYRGWHLVNRKEELLQEEGGEVGGGLTEGSAAVGDGGQAAISLMPDADGIGSDSLLGPDAHLHL